MPRVRKQERGFTLVELLVVLSIIALLIALLLPSLRSVREQSRQVVCRKNLFNIWQGVVSYTFEYNDRVPYLETVSTDLDPYDDRHPTLVGNVLGPYVDRGSLVCPSAVAGYPETDPNSRYKWKLTYDFSTADRSNPGVGTPYDDAEAANSGEYPDPAVVNNYHFDGRPLRTLKIGRMSANSAPGPDMPSGDDDIPNPDGVEIEIVSTYSIPLVADTLAELKPGDAAAGRAIYPHRGLVRRQSETYLNLFAAPDPRAVPSRQPGYFHLYGEKDHSEVFLTRFSADTVQDDD